MTIMMSLRSGNKTTVDVSRAKSDGRKRKNPKQQFESDSEDDFPTCNRSAEARTRKPKILMKKCDLCGKSFRSNVHLKEHMVKHPEPDLFVRPDGLPMTFVMASSLEMEEVKMMVEEGGGAMLETPEGDNWVWLLTAKEAFMGHSEAFSTNYVKDCVKQRKLLADLSKYRVGRGGPRYKENPLEVMLGFRGWTDSTPIDIKPKKSLSIYDMGLIAEERDMEAFESFLAESESLELQEHQPESLSDMIKSFESEADILDEVQEWARTELAKSEMSEYLPKCQKNLPKSEFLPNFYKNLPQFQKDLPKSNKIRPKTPDEGFESGSDEEEMNMETQVDFSESSNVENGECKLADVTKHKIIHMFPCKYCRKSFKDEKSLKTHHKFIHHEGPAETGKRFSCDQCQKTFAKFGTMKNHAKRCAGASLASNADLKKHKSVQHSKQSLKFSCKYCEKTFINIKSHVETHERQHRQHRDGLFPCEECKESFANTIYLRKVFEKNTALVVID